MTTEILTIPALADNYCFLIHNAASGATALVDAPEAAPVRDALSARGWRLDQILLTHHHYDHIDGTAELVAEYGAKVIGAAADQHRLPPLDKAVSDGDHFDTVGHDTAVIDVSGHTVGHVAFHMPDLNAAFTADSLMALGCGRIFEGTPEQMFSSLNRLKTLPPETVLYSGHEYTRSNAQFALTIDPENVDLQNRAAETESARAKDVPTVPSRLSDELATNPFLRAHTPGIKRNLAMEDRSDLEVFTEVRHRKDNF